jgi:hypothetical protein
VIPVAPDRSVPPDHAIHRPRNADREPLESAYDRLVSVGFHQHVQMIRLHRKLQDPKTCAGRDAECAPDGSEETCVTQRGQPGASSQRNVRRTTAVVGRPMAMRHAGTASGRRLSAGSGATTTPSPDRELELSPMSPHLIGQRCYTNLVCESIHIPGDGSREPTTARANVRHTGRPELGQRATASLARRLRRGDRRGGPKEQPGTDDARSRANPVVPPGLPHAVEEIGHDGVVVSQAASRTSARRIGPTRKRRNRPRRRSRGCSGTAGDNLPISWFPTLAPPTPFVPRAE